METDTTLLSAARKMDQDALVQIFDLYSGLLYKYALRLCSDPVLADHIVGDVFAKLLDQLASGNGPTENLRSYLYEITYHRIIDEARQARRQIPLDVAIWLREDTQSTVLTLEDRIMLKQILQAMQTELTDDQRHVIILRFLEEFSIRETATILGKSSNHVRVIQNRAIGVLRRCLEYQEVMKVVLSQRFRSPSSTLAPLGVQFAEHPVEI